MKLRRVLPRFFLGLLLLIGLGLVGEQLARWQVRRALPLAGRWVRVGDHRLHVRTYGTGGPVVVFESGLAPQNAVHAHPSMPTATASAKSNTVG
ncbi:MAG: hypothetical protein ACRYFZ_10475 [Janthinobacterium lividum]